MTNYQNSTVVLGGKRGRSDEVKYPVLVAVELWPNYRAGFPDKEALDGVEEWLSEVHFAIGIPKHFLLVNSRGVCNMLKIYPEEFVY